MKFRFIDKLDDIVKTYNKKIHRMTKLSPEEGEKQENSIHIQQMHENYYNKVKPTKRIRFRIKDLVRISRSRLTFARGYDRKSQEEIYRIVKMEKKLLGIFTKSSLQE